MPIYSYKCVTCDYIKDRFRKMEDRNRWLVCPHCRKRMYHILSPFSAHTWKPLELELETNKPRTYETKKDLDKDCHRLGKSMPSWDINCKDYKDGKRG